MKYFFLLLFTTTLGFTVAGCNLQLGCTEVSCSSGVDVSVALAALAAEPAVQLPLLVEACLDGGSCFTAKITKTGGAFACQIIKGSSFDCGVVSPGSELRFAFFLEEPESATVGAIVSVTVTDGTSAKVFEDQQITVLETTAPNGPGCEPICRQGAVTFTP